jgi:hypothetical protein
MGSVYRQQSHIMVHVPDTANAPILKEQYRHSIQDATNSSNNDIRCSSFVSARKTQKKYSSQIGKLCST